MNDDTRTIVVSGSSSGIGRAIAQRLLDQGHRVIGLARRQTLRHEAFEALNVDLARLDELPGILTRLARQHPDIDGVVCCAGRGRFGSLEEFSPAQIRELIDLNLTSQIYLLRELLPLLKRRRRGHIVLMGSEAALTGGRRGAVYSASKFALRGLAQSLREECARARIHVTLVNPGMVDTPFFDKLDFRPGDAPEHHLQTTDIVEAVLLALNQRSGAVIDEINLSPLQKVIRFGNE